MRPNDEVIEKIRKMLAIAHCDGAQPGEVEVAMAKAKEIAMRHSIDIASVDLNKGQGRRKMDIGMDTGLKTRSKFEQPYHLHIYHVLDRVFGVHIIRNGHSDQGLFKVNFLYLIGDPTDIAVARVVFPWLEKVFPKSLSRRVRDGILTYKAADMNGWYQGLAWGIIKANKRQEDELAKEDKETWGLIVRDKKAAIDEFIGEKFKDLKQGKARSREFSAFAAGMGMQEGQKINLNQIG